MSFVSFLKDLSFNLLGADVVPAGDDQFHLKRPNGTTVTLLDHGPFALERGNTRLPSGELQLGAAFRSICAIPKMSTLTIGSIINAAVSNMSRENTFVNVGVWHGYTFLAGLHGNADVPAIGIDNFSQFGGPRAEFLHRFGQASSDQHAFIEADYRDVFADRFADSIGVYVYDGAHSYKNQLDGLRLAEPFFADGCIVIIDDANWPAAREATFDFMAGSSRDYSILLDVPTPGKHPTLWNGLLVLQEGKVENAMAITRIPAPRLPSVDPPRRRSNETVAVLIDIRASEVSATTATLNAVRSQSHSDLASFTFGPPTASLPDIRHYDSAVDALAVSDSAYALLVDAGLAPTETAIENALSWSLR